MSDCEALYRDVMGLRSEDGSINPRLLIALQHNGGLVLGAYLDDRLIGFAYSFLGSDSYDGVTELYQYSQLAVVARDMQGQGIGRQLKYAQRSRCLQRQIGVMRWAFDPMKTRNAHFNLDVLGARVTDFVPSMYGATGFGADAADGTDRFIVSWELTSNGPSPAQRVERRNDDQPGTLRAEGDDVVVIVPSGWETYRERNTTEARALRALLRAEFAQLLRDGRVGVSCNPLGTSLMAYRFATDDHSSGTWRAAC